MKYIAFLMVALLVGCATGQSTKKLQKITIGMSKAEIVGSIGDPTAVRGAIVNKFGQNVEVWEYTLNKPKTAQDKKADIGMTVLTFGLLLPAALAGSGDEVDYWLYFHDDKLFQWGQAGDWKQEADRIMEIRVNPKPTP